MVNWALATRPRLLGGLGVREIQTTNHALLMKWLWDWHKHRGAWWTQATHLPCLSDKPWQASNASSFWKSLAHIAPAFHSSIRFQVQNGRATQFWHDNWRGSPFYLLFPNLYSLVQNKLSSVDQCVQDLGWLHQLTTLSPVAQDEKDHMLLSLHHIQMSQELDEVIWIRSAHCFSVQSAYNFMTLSPSPDSSLRHVWKTKGPLRIQIFSWLLMSNKLATIDNLARRGWHLPNMCVMCKNDEETALHLFQQCPLAKEIRSYVHTAFGHRYLISPRFNTPSSIEAIVDPTENMTTRHWEITTCFVIWREKCRRIFNDKEVPPISIIREIYTEQRAWFLQTAEQTPQETG